MFCVPSIYKTVFIIAACSYAVNGANILAIFIMPSYSHQMPMLRLTKALAARGHNLTVITTDPSKEPIANHTEIDISFCYDMLRTGQLGISLTTKINLFRIIKQGSHVVIKLGEVQLKSPQVQDFLSWAKDVKYDLVLLEHMWVTPYLAMVHTLGSPPVIGITTVELTGVHTEIDGTPLNLAYSPIFQPFTDHMSFKERLLNVAVYFWHLYIRHMYLYHAQDKLIEEVFGEGMPSARELEKNKSLMMFSSDGSLVYPRAKTPNIIQLGPLHIVEPKPLPADLENWVSGAEDGVIYFSLGSIMPGTSVPKDTREAFLSVFERFPNYRVVWKWESDTYYPGKPKNVMFRKWIPQQDLLARPNVKLFIMQGGLQSLQEAIHYAVPVVCIPFFADQEMNCHKMNHAEAGVQLDFFDVTNKTLFTAVNNVLNLSKYRENMKRMSDISKDRILSPLDLGIWWVEHVLRHKGATHLRPATLDLHWSQYLLLDVAAFVIAVLCLTTFVVFKLGKLLYTTAVHHFSVYKIKQS